MSSAGHPPPILLHPVTCSTRPPTPRWARACSTSPRPEADQTYTPGDILVLCTDGLIERRGEDIDTGLGRLTGALARYCALGPEAMADTLLAQLGVAGGARDDIALIIIRL
ncbi:PP2C family protein-serine/threonine phosphatase [Streptomyces puniciscabiei]|uniref:PP2C family protein-serine/threonine phosphatase n=1 Tax=Streptomyces puniciscabiei TaxID=164348 RepID=UPI00333456DD